MADEQRIALVNPNGKLVSLPSEQVKDALDFGYSMPDAAQQKEVHQREQYGTGLGNEVRAGLEGAARGLTFGLSDVGMQALGAEKEGIAERKARNPYSAAGGEIAGVGAGLLAPIGLLGAGVKGAAAAGELVAGGVGRGLAALGAEEGSSLAVRALAKGVEHGAGSAVEGALYGAGQGVSEAALGDPTDAAQKILAHASVGALLGGVLGGAGGALGAVGKRTLEAFSPATAAAADEASPLAQRAMGAEGAPAAEPSLLRKGIAKVGSVVSGADESVLRDLVDVNSAEGVAVRKAAFGDHAVDDAAIRTLTKHIGTAEEESLPLLEQARGKLKDEHIAKIVKKGNVQAQSEAAYDALGSMQQVVEEMKADPTTYGHVAGIKKLEKYIDGYEKHIAQAVESGDGGKIFAELDNLKANIGQLAKPRQGVAYTHQDRTTFDALQNLYKTQLMPTLESQALWGKAGELQARVNKKWTELLYNHNLFRGEFMKEVGSKDWEKVFAANPASVESYLGSVGRARNDLKHQLLTSHLDKLSDFAREVRDAYELGGDMGAKVDKIASASKGANSEIESALKTSAIRNEAKKILETRTGRGLAQVAKLEERVRAGLGQDVSAAATSTLGPEQGARVAQLAHMERAANDVTRQVKRAMDGLVSKLKDIPKVAVPTSVKAMHEIYLAPKERGNPHTADRETAYDKRLTEITNLAQNPQLMKQRLSASLGDLDQFAPRVSTELHFAVQQAINYLYQAAPKNPYLAATIDMRRAWRPSSTELVSFEKTLRAIHDPIGVIKDFEHGHVSKEAADALRAVYPSIYAQMVTHLVPKIAETEGIPLQRRLELADVLGVTLDSLTDPASTASYQAMYAQPPGGAPAPAAHPGVSKNYRAQQSATPLQRITQG